jgi:hypothetical protein
MSGFCTWSDKVEWKVTDINNVLNLTKNGGDRSANDGHSLEETGLANEDVEENLMNANKLDIRLAVACG